MKTEMAGSAVHEDLNYEQIDTIRLIMICFIIWGHSLIGWDKHADSILFESYFTTIVYQSGKISTIIFFIVTGFLIRRKLPTYTLKSYFLGRLSRVYIPWLLFITIFLILQTLQVLPLIEFWREKHFRGFLSGVYSLIVGVLFYTSYWFIITYAISMALLILFKKYADGLWTGLILAGLAIFYSVNLHYQWIPASHGKTLFGYAFYVWVGLRIHKYSHLIFPFLKKVSWPLIISILIVLFIASCIEARLLVESGCVDPYASNRFSNSLFSIVFFISLLKMGKIARLNSLEPRKLVYGIFLVHNIVILEFALLVKSVFPKFLDSNIWFLLVYQILFFAIIVIVTFAIVKKICYSRFSWSIGLIK